MKVVVSDGTYYMYTYDANNNLIKVEEGNGTDKNVTEYTYDLDNRETQTKTGGKTYTTTYDSLGRITKLSWDTTEAFETNLTYNSGAPTDTVVYGYTSEWADQMTSYDRQTVTYDSIGNPLNYLGKTLTWTKGRQLSGISDSSMNYSYSYNVDGIRTQKKNNTTNAVTTYQLDGDVIAAQTTKNASNTVTEQMTFTYDSSGSVIVMTYNGTQYFYKKNGQGDIIGLIIGCQVVY